MPALKLHGLVDLINEWHHRSGGGRWAIVCEDIETDPRVNDQFREYFMPKGTKKFLAVPTLVGGQVRGMIMVRHSKRPPYRTEEIGLMQALAHQVMLAIRLTEVGEQGRQAAVLAERNRMARDVHDALAHESWGDLACEAKDGVGIMNLGSQPGPKRRQVTAASMAGRDPSSARPPKARIRVLIADDHGVVREGLASMIRRNKADMTVVGEARNGREAVELWKAHRPDVTLLDLRMPELDGVEAIKAIRATDEKARIEPARARSAKADGARKKQQGDWFRSVH